MSRNRIKIAHIITSLGLGGTEAMLAKLVARQKDLYDVQVFSLGEDGPIGDRIRELGIPVHAFGMKPSRPPVFEVFRLKRALKKFRPEITQTWLYHADWIGGHLAKQAGCQIVIWSIRNMPETADAHWITKRLLELCASKSATFPARIVSNSYAAAVAHQERGYDLKKMVVIPNGFDLDAFQFLPQARARLRHEWGIRDEEFLVGTLGRVHPDKGYDVLLQAMPHVELVRWALVGAGTEGLELPEPLASRTLRLGSRLDSCEVLSAFDLFVSPSHREGFSNSIAEAMACERPVVVSNAGDSALITGGNRVVAVGDAEALSNEIRNVVSLSSGERSREGQANRRRIEQEFPMVKTAEHYEKLYLEVLAECAG